MIDRREYEREWARNNRERRREYQRQWVRNNPEKAREVEARYRSKNREKILQKNTLYNARRHSTSKLRKLVNDMSQRLELYVSELQSR